MAFSNDDTFEDDFRKVGQDVTGEFEPVGSETAVESAASGENLGVAGKTDDLEEDDEDELEDEDDLDDEDDLEDDDEETDDLEETADDEDDTEDDDIEDDEDDEDDDDDEELEDEDTDSVKSRLADAAKTARKK